jgi:hypothetical protein
MASEWSRVSLLCGAILWCAAADTEFQLLVDPLPKSYRVTTERGSGDAEQSGRHSDHIGILADITVPLPTQGFTEDLYPIGGIGFDYAYRHDADLLDQALRLKFHYGLAYRPWRVLRFDVQVFLAPQADFTTLPRALVRGESERDWLLTGMAYGADAGLVVQLRPWLGLTLRGGVEGDYVSARGDNGITVTLRDGGTVAALGVVLTSD